MSSRHTLSKKFRDLFLTERPDLFLTERPDLLLAGRPEAQAESSDQMQADRDSIQKVLKTKLDKLVETAPDIIIPSKLKDKLSITISELVLRSDGCCSSLKSYFKPWHLAELEKYFLDINEPFTMDHMETTEKIWQDVDKKEDDFMGRTSQLLCSLLTDEIWLARVKEGEQEQTSLERVRGMRLGGLDDEIMEYHWTERLICGDPTRTHPLEPRRHDVDTWFYESEIDEHPHLTVALSHDRASAEEIFYNELICLIAMMVTRLELPPLSDHLVIPLNVLSCFKDWKARNLQVHLTSKGLMVYKSKLFDFSNPETRKDYIKLFTLYLCSEPIGDTEVLAGEEIA